MLRSPERARVLLSLIIEKEKASGKNGRLSHRKKADDGNRTRLPSLGSWYSTDELHLRFVFYYSTFLKKVIRGKGKNQKNQK